MKCEELGSRDRRTGVACTCRGDILGAGMGNNQRKLSETRDCDLCVVIRIIINEWAILLAMGGSGRGAVID